MKEKIEKYNLKVIEFLKELEYYGVSKLENQIFIINGENKKKYESLMRNRFEIQMLTFDMAAEAAAGIMEISTIDNARHNAHVSWYLASLASTVGIVEFGKDLSEIVKIHYIVNLSPEVYKFRETEFDFVKYHEIGHAVNDHILDLANSYDDEINLGNLKFPKNEIIADAFAFEHMSDKTGFVEKRTKFFAKQIQKACKKHLKYLDIISRHTYIPFTTRKVLKDVFKVNQKNFNELVSNVKLELCDRAKFAEVMSEQMEMV